MQTGLLLDSSQGCLRIIFIAQCLFKSTRNSSKKGIEKIWLSHPCISWPSSFCRPVENITPTVDDGGGTFLAWMGHQWLNILLMDFILISTRFFKERYSFFFTLNLFVVSKRV